jgi:hypothetical protein
MARRDEGKYRQYLTEKQRRQAGCSAGRMQRDFHHGLLWPGLAEAVSTANCASVKPSSGGIVPRCVLQGWDAASLTTGLGATLGYHHGLLVQ